MTSTLVSCGRYSTISYSPWFCVAGVGYGTGLVLVARNAAALCVAGVVQSHIQLGFAWQTWCNFISTFVLRSRRGTISYPASFCVVGVALVALGGALGLVLVARNAAAIRVAGAAQGNIYLGVSRPPSFCVAAVAQSHIHLRFVWQAWHLWHWVARLGWFTCLSRTVFTDKQQLATDFARSPRTVSPDEQWCKLICARRTQFHVPLGTQTFQLPQSLQDIGAIVPRAQGRSFLKQQLDGILCRVVVTHDEPST